MVVKKYSIAPCGLFLFLSGSILAAAPRLSLSQTALTVSVNPGSNGDAQSVDAANLGDGSLSLQVSASVPWLVPTIGQAHSCSVKGSCIPIQIALPTGSLPKGTSTGTVTVSDPNAVDAPQFITVTVFVGGSVPDKVEFFVPPGGSASTRFTTVSLVNATVNNAPWLSIAIDGTGSFRFNVPYRVTATAQNGMGAGDYNGSIVLTGSSFASDNKTISAILHVTTQPVLVAAPNQVQLRIAQNSSKQTTFVGIANGGQGALSISNVSATTASGGGWLSAQAVSGGGAISITADPTGLATNVYQGTVTITSNAANPSVAIPVQLSVVAQTPPVAFAGGVVNNGTFASGEDLAPGDIAAVFGDQFTSGDPTAASSLPLQTTLGGVQVLVNGQPAPLYYVSAGQINFEIPIDAAAGDATISVVRNGQKGNTIFLTINSIVPRFLLLQGGPFAIMTTAAGALTGIPGAPAKGGDVVVIYMIGLGPTSPSVPSGTGSPSNPLAVVNPRPQVCFGNNTPFSQAVCVDAQFAGLTPGFVGLYQVNVGIPQGLPAGNVPLSLSVNGVQSDIVQLAIQ